MGIRILWLSIHLSSLAAWTYPLAGRILCKWSPCVCRCWCNR